MTNEEIDKYVKLNLEKIQSENPEKFEAFFVLAVVCTMLFKELVKRMPEQKRPAVNGVVEEHYP